MNNNNDWNNDHWNDNDYVPPIDPNACFNGGQGYAPEEGKKKASEAQMLGVIALIGLALSGVLGIIFGILAISSANRSRTLVGFDLPEAKHGRIFGMIGLIGSIFGVLLNIILLIVALT